MNFIDLNMEYYRSNIAGGIAQSNPNDVSNTLLNSTNDTYASSYWNIPYTDNGVSPMKQIEGKSPSWNNRFDIHTFYEWNNKRSEGKKKNLVKYPIWIETFMKQTRNSFDWSMAHFVAHFFSTEHELIWQTLIDSFKRFLFADIICKMCRIGFHLKCMPMSCRLQLIAFRHKWGQCKAKLSTKSAI